MKVVHLSTSDLDGGAARAAHRLHQGMLDIDIGSQMLVRAKLGEDETVVANKTVVARFGSKLDSLPLKRYPQRQSALFSTEWFPDSVVSRLKQLDPDVVNLHWICNGFMQIESLPKFNKPIVWTLHDMWPLTGGCHYTQMCDRYLNNCGNCPQLNSQKLFDLSYDILSRKLKAWRDLDLTLVTPSQWLADCARASKLFRQSRVEVIPNGIDTDLYRPINKKTARAALNLPQDKRLVLFGAGSSSGDLRKGFRYLLSALQQLDATRWKTRLELVVFGEDEGTQLPIDFKAHFLGRLEGDVALATAYSAADLFVAPSVQDNLPNTVVEALSCGTPCAAFKIGGMPDMIAHHQNGYLAEPFDVKDLARGIVWAIESDKRHGQICDHARTYALRHFELRAQSQQYADLYEDLLDKKSKP